MSVSRSFRELADIVYKQEILENLKEKLQVLLDDINQVTKRCTSWIERTEPITYLELRQYLTDKTSKYIQQCATLVYPELTKEGIKEVSDKESISADSSGYKDEKNYKILEEETINIQKTKKSDKNNKKTTKESQEISTQSHTEMYLAREFMFTLQSKFETLTQETHKSIQSQDKKIEEFSDDVEKRIEQINLLVKQYNDDLLKIEQQNLKKELEISFGHVESLKAKEKSLTEELENSKQLIKNGKDEIKKLQATEEKSKTILQEYIQKIRYIFKDMEPRYDNDWPIERTKKCVKGFDKVENGTRACKLCRTVTNNCWYIPRLNELCKGCWHKELGI
ncbi:uncharacterized protein LOC129923500 [Biomphalaria glabrata]|uniref:Uncharacterized protein LOC129923500 n=1 Tax=Biomphalaria glabrata TaxID=6526 RepID=A0A9W2Z6S1_BIOGL|nr:uncharacterized protein LOC129923500 [Biomphalaria glabrata]